MRKRSAGKRISISLAIVMLLCIMILTIFVGIASRQTINSPINYQSDAEEELLPLWMCEIGSKWVTSLSISSDGNYIAVGGADHYIYYFDKSGELLWKYRTGGDVGSVSCNVH